MIKWLLTLLEDNYRTAYWESVAQNEAWLNLMMSIIEDE